ncbi:MAG: hypothetical protein ACRC1F_01830 [Metamycoplasmataceae bacterium]
MIKQIVFKTNNSLEGTPLIINFDEHINIIIGPKGGGKSTLFDLLAGIQNGYISKSVIDALKEFGLIFDKAIKFNNEIINANQLTKKTKKEMETDFEGRYDVIFQDDPIKKNINNLDQIDKQKKEYVQDLIDKSPIILELIKKIENFYNGMVKISIMNNQNEINWTNAFQIKSPSDGKTKLIIKLNYNDTDISQKIDIEKRNLNIIIKNAREQKVELEKFKTLNFNNVSIDEVFNNELNQKINKLQKDYDEIESIVKARELYISKISNMTMCFKAAYKKTIEEIKKKDFGGAGLKAYEKQAQDYFKKLANEIVYQKNLFEELINNEVVLNFKEKEVNNSLLSYKIDSVVKLDQEEIVDILKIVLPTPGGSISDISKWLLNLIKNGPKEFDRKRISNCISRNLKKYVKVLAEGKDYDTMSLGQKSIYGIKYKFNNSMDKALFLDQPEDNLDNHTIATNILEMLSLKKDQQVFIVTHNANIGILTNPEKVIVADLNSSTEQYYESTTINTENGELDSAHYLEGGVDFLERRYMKIKGEK